jgi:hypothetical protein
MREAVREEVLRRLGALPDGDTGFDLANVRRMLEGADCTRADGPDVLLPHPWTREGWERYANAVERVATTVLRRHEVDGKIGWTYEDGSQLTEAYLADAKLIVWGSPQVVTEVERLRTLVRAADLALNADEQKVMGLIVAGLELLAVDPCGHDPAEHLDEHCPSCRMRTALRGFGHAGDPAP